MPRQLAAEGGKLVFAGAKPTIPKRSKTLKRLGFRSPRKCSATVRGWHLGRTPAVRSPRARERLTEVPPLLIAALAETVDPDGAYCELRPVSCPACRPASSFSRC